MNKNKKKENNKLITSILLYVKNIITSIFISLLIILLLVVQTRSNVIENLNKTYVEKFKFNKKFAEEILSSSYVDMNFYQKNFSTCMYFASLYYTAERYEDAKKLYKIAISKAKPHNYKAHLKYVEILIIQNKLDKAEKFLQDIKDEKNKNLIKMKSYSYMLLGDAWYKQKKYLKAVNFYNKSKSYYDLFYKKKKRIDKQLIDKSSDCYNKIADIMVNSNYIEDAINYLKKAEAIKSDDFNTRYKLAILYSDFSPLKSLDYFEELTKEQPQKIDNNIYIKALMHSANVYTLAGEETKAKLYRYKIYSFEEFLKRKVVYKDDFEIIVQNIKFYKKYFKYHIQTNVRIQNFSLSDVNKLKLEVLLKKDGKILDTINKDCVKKENVLQADGDMTKPIDITFNKKFYSKKDVQNCVLEFYLYKDEKYKTYITTLKIPEKKSLFESY